MYDLQEKISESRKQEPLASIVKRLGNPESTTLLHSPCEVFQSPKVDGVIAYYQIKNCAVAIGDPICLPQDIPELTQKFHQHCQENQLRTVYLLAHNEFARWAINNGYHTLIQVGSELSIDPVNFQIKQKLRWKINQAIQHGVEVKEYDHNDPLIEKQMKNTIATWLNQRRGPQIYLGKLNFFNSAAEKRLMYAQQNGQIIGILMLTPVDRFEGWVVSSYLAIQNAPVGTSEHLMCSTFDALAQENCRFLCLGVIAGSKLGEMTGIGTFGKTFANFIFKMARWSFKLDAKSAYLHKYHPSSRSTFFLCRDKLSLAELLALKHVFNAKLC